MYSEITSFDRSSGGWNKNNNNAFNYCKVSSYVKLTDDWKRKEMWPLLPEIFKCQILQNPRYGKTFYEYMAINDNLDWYGLFGAFPLKEGEGKELLRWF